jgi:hypothetical protein
MSISDEAQARKDTPIWSGFVNYFPKAMAEVARLSKVGNDQHNPGSELHWDRSKSGDERDACMRHLTDAGTIDTDGVRHSTKCAWRAMANLEKELEQADAQDEPQGELGADTIKRSARETVTLGDVLDNIERTTKIPEGKFTLGNGGEDTRPRVPRRPYESDGAAKTCHDGCANCLRLQNEIDRHECRWRNPGANSFYTYLRNYNQYDHYMRFVRRQENK